MASRLVCAKPLSESMLDIFNCTLKNKIQLNLYRNSNIFIKENVFESVVCEMAAILSRPQCFKWVGTEQRPALILFWLCFYQTRSAWSMDQGSNKNHSPFNNFTPTVTKFCVMWEGQALPHDTKFRNCTGEIVDSRAFSSWFLIHGSSWSGLIKAEPGRILASYDICASANHVVMTPKVRRGRATPTVHHENMK